MAKATTVDPSKRKPRWYFGGISSACAACITHPLDLVKVHLQTQQQSQFGMLRMGIRVFQTDGIMGLYNGISASLLRQFTFTLTRFGVFDAVKNRLSSPDKPLDFASKSALAGFSGALGGFVGNPADLINVRMQNDMKLPLDQRRNYKHAIDGFIRLVREEGFRAPFNGASMTSIRGCFMTIGQAACYDQMKQVLITHPVTSQYFKDNVFTHLTASITAAAAAVVMTQPFDVMKTRMMKAAPGEYSGLAGCAADVLKNGPLGFFKGTVPAFIRIGPHTVILFLIFEQLRRRFGF